MRYFSIREIGDNAAFKIWSFVILEDLRARIEQGGIP